MAFDFVDGYGGTVTWMEKKSRTTAENARYSYTLLAQEDKTEIILITSALHMRRAKWSFEQAGFKVLPGPTHFTELAPLHFNSFMPKAQGLLLSSMAIHEWLGYWYYQILEQ